MEEVVRMLGNYLRVCEKHYAKSVQSRLGLACSGNVERIGIVLSKPNHTKSLKNQWRATYAPGCCGIAIYETGGEGGIQLRPFCTVLRKLRLESEVENSLALEFLQNTSHFCV